MPDSATTSGSDPFPAARIIALMNQKGGVGKTTTTVNLAAGIARLGRRTLVVDLDPQAHASLHLGVDPATFPGRDEHKARSVYDLLADPTLDPTPAIHSIGDNLAVLPAETDLAGLETELSEIAPAERTTRLRAVLDRLAAKPGKSGGEDKAGFEFILIDCPPSLGVLTLNGLAAAREVLIPMQAHFLALQGVSKLLETVQLVGKTVNPALRVSGVILCMHDPASSHVKEVVQDLASFFEQARTAPAELPWKGAKVFDPPVRRNIKLAECPSFGQTIFQYAPFCPGALDYKALAQTLVTEWDDLKARAAAAAAQSAPAKPVVTTRRSGKAAAPKPAAAEAARVMSLAEALRRHRSTLRILFWGFAATLFTLTHWPALEVHVAGIERVDLLAHFSFFGGWLTAFWLTGYIGDPFRARSIILSVIIACLYAGFDEGLQAIPWVRRHCAWDDYGANCTGIAIAASLATIITVIARRRTTPRPPKP